MNNNNEVTIFNNDEFGEVRTLIINDEPWFSARDIAKCLNYVNTKKAILDNVDREDTMGLTRGEISGYLSGTPKEWGKINSQGMKFVNESGLYSLIMNSNKPEAKRFKKWITSEVLPSIRKTGKYSVKNEESEKLSNKDLVELCKTILECEELPSLYKQAIAAHTCNNVTGKYLMPLPEVEITYSATDVAKELGTSKQKVGRIANKYNLKTPKYGIQVMDLSTNGKQVPNFRYNEVEKK